MRAEPYQTGRGPERPPLPAAGLRPRTSSSLLCSSLPPKLAGFWSSLTARPCYPFSGKLVAGLRVTGEVEESVYLFIYFRCPLLPCDTLPQVPKVPGYRRHLIAPKWGEHWWSRFHAQLVKWSCSAPLGWHTGWQIKVRTVYGCKIIM